jgi:hypothetical protein
MRQPPAVQRQLAAQRLPAMLHPQQALRLLRADAAS